MIDTFFKWGGMALVQILIYLTIAMFLIAL